MKCNISWSSQSKKNIHKFQCKSQLFIDKLQKVVYSFHFIDNIAKSLIKAANDVEDSYIVQPNFIQKTNTFHFHFDSKFFCNINETKSKDFI